MTAIPPEYLNQIVTGDARELAKRIPDESIDLIFTDPPYHDDFLWMWSWLSGLGARVLKPGGLLLAYAGKHAMPVVYSGLGENLGYFWTLAGVQFDSNDRFWSRHILGAWRPIVVFCKGDANTPWLPDARTTNRDKNFHEWGQGANVFYYYIERLTEANDIVLDPCVGGGTVPAVCKMLSRNYIAFEIDPDVAARARERVRNTQPPLFVLQPEQIEMDIV